MDDEKQNEVCKSGGHLFVLDKMPTKLERRIKLINSIEGRIKKLQVLGIQADGRKGLHLVQS